MRRTILAISIQAAYGRYLSCVATPWPRTVFAPPSHLLEQPPPMGLLTIHTRAVRVRFPRNLRDQLYDFTNFFSHDYVPPQLRSPGSSVW